MQQAKKYFFVGDARKKKVLEFNVKTTTFLVVLHTIPILKKNLKGFKTINKIYLKK